MPCSCENYPGEHSDMAAKEAIQRADAATRAACDLRTVLRRGGKEEDLTKETRKWISVHDKADARRVKQEIAEGVREKRKNKAEKKYRKLMKSMSLEERRVLGL